MKILPVMQADESHDYANFPTEEAPTRETQSENSDTFNESGSVALSAGNLSVCAEVHIPAAIWCLYQQ